MATPLPQAYASLAAIAFSLRLQVLQHLDLLFAIAVSLSGSYRQARGSLKQIRDFIISLEASFREVDEFMKTVKQVLEVIRNPAAGL